MMSAACKLILYRLLISPLLCLDNGPVRFAYLFDSSSFNIQFEHLEKIERDVKCERVTYICLFSTHRKPNEFLSHRSYFACRSFSSKFIRESMTCIQCKEDNYFAAFARPKTTNNSRPVSRLC